MKKTKKRIARPNDFENFTVYVSALLKRVKFTSGNLLTAKSLIVVRDCLIFRVKRRRNSRKVEILLRK